MQFKGSNLYLFLVQIQARLNRGERAGEQSVAIFSFPTDRFKFIYFSEGGSEYETVHHQVASVVPKPLDSLIRFATDMEIDKFVNQLTVSEGNPTNEEN